MRLQHGYRPRRCAPHVHTQGPCHRGDGREDIGAFAGEPIDHECTRRHPRGEHMAGIDAEVGDQLGDQSRDEPDVIDSLPVGHRRSAAVGPTEVDAVGVDHDEPVRIGDGIVVRFPLPIRPDRPGTMEIHDETGRMLETRRHVQAVGAGQSPEVKPAWLARPGRPGSASGKTRDHTKGRQRQMTTTSESQARRFHWRYWTATTAGALSYPETFPQSVDITGAAHRKVLRGSPLVRGPPAAVQALAIRDEQRVAAAEVRAYRDRGRDIGCAVARDDDGGQTGGGRGPQA